MRLEQVTFRSQTAQAVPAAARFTRFQVCRDTPRYHHHTAGCTQFLGTGVPLLYSPIRHFHKTLAVHPSHPKIFITLKQGSLPFNL
jgi:hypothetical protein